MFPGAGPRHGPSCQCEDCIPVRTSGDQLLTEAEAILAWRLYVLLGSYPLELAERLAVARQVDLHEAVELVAAGCNPVTAADILL